MPRIAQYGESQVDTQVVSSPRARVPRVDTGIAQGVADFATGLGSLGERMDTTAAEEALLGFERDKNNLFFNPESGYFNTQGRNAFDGAKDTSTEMDKLKKTYEDSLGSVRAKQMFSKVADRHVVSGNTDILRHSAKGAQSWEAATLAAQAENSVENAVLYFNDPDKMNQQRAVGEMAIVESSKIKGIGAEATNEQLQTYNSSFSQAAITGAIAHSAAQGQEAFDKYGDTLEGPAKIKMESAIVTKQKTEETQRLASGSIILAEGIVDTHESLEARNDAIRNIPDEKMRGAVRKQVKYISDAQAKADKENAAETYNSAYDGITGNNPTGRKMSPLEVQALDPEGWAKMTPEQKQSINSGKLRVTNQDLFTRLRLLPKKKLAQVDPTAHITELSNTDYNALVRDVRTAQGVASPSETVDSQIGRSRTSQTSSAITQIFGTSAKLSKGAVKLREAKINAFHALVDSEVEHRQSSTGKTLTSTEYTALLNDMTRQVVLEKPWYQSDETLDISEVPAEDIPTLTDYLRDNGVPVTSDNLIKAYEQATQ